MNLKKFLALVTATVLTAASAQAAVVSHSNSHGPELTDWDPAKTLSLQQFNPALHANCRPLLPLRLCFGFHRLLSAPPLPPAAVGELDSLGGVTTWPAVRCPAPDKSLGVRPCPGGGNVVTTGQAHNFSWLMKTSFTLLAVSLLGLASVATAQVTNQNIVVEASTNLVHWQPIWTNPPPGASTNFVDPEWLQHSNRFYRSRSN